MMLVYNMFAGTDKGRAHEHDIDAYPLYVSLATTSTGTISMGRTPMLAYIINVRRNMQVRIICNDGYMSTSDIRQSSVLKEK